jgi:uncharacterized membrane protein
MHWVAGSISVLAVLISLRFWLLGAWPVVPFSVVEVGLVLLMLHLNTRQARASELILLNATELRIVRTTSSGQRREKVLPSGWLSVSLFEREGRVPRLMLCQRGVREEIGAALGAAEKRDLAASLTQALHAARYPTFDNAQLRD